MTPRTNAFDSLMCSPDKLGGIKRLRKLHHIDQVMRYLPPFFGGWLCRADLQPPVNLH